MIACRTHTDVAPLLACRDASGGYVRFFLTLIVTTIYHLGLPLNPIYATDGFGVAEARAVRLAAAKVHDSIVRIELIGGVTGQRTGDVELHAPSVGTIVGSEGWILASSMVSTPSAASLLVTLPDGSRLIGKIAARDIPRELVLLKVNPRSPLKPISMTHTFEPKVGQYAIAVGQASNTGSPLISVGIVSALGRLWGRALQTDARISPAFYGGPLVDIEGRVLGLVIPANAQEGDPDKTRLYDSGIAFAIPLQAIHDRLNTLKSGKDIRQGYLGIIPSGSSPFADGTVIDSVRLHSPAAKAGIQNNDRILSIEGKPVSYFYQVRLALETLDAGDLVSMTIERNKKPIPIKLNLVAELPPFKPQRIGIRARSENKTIIVTAVMADSPAAQGGLQPGDTITHLANLPIQSMESLRRRIMSVDPDEPMRVTVSRGGGTHQLQIGTETIAGKLKNLDRSEPVEDATDWDIKPFTMPGIANKVVYLAPSDDANVHGLLVMLAKPGLNSADTILDTLRLAAKQHRVAIVVMFPAHEKGWNPRESQVVSSVLKTCAQKWNVGRSSTGLTCAEEKDSAGLLMTAWVANTLRSQITGLFFPSMEGLERMRWQENSPAFPLQLGVSEDNYQETSDWLKELPKRGYPIVQTQDTQPSTIVRWVSSLSLL